MEIDLSLLRSLSTVFAFVAFIGVCLWAYNGKHKARFEEASQLPFSDDDSENRVTNSRQQSDANNQQLNNSTHSNQKVDNQ